MAVIKDLYFLHDFIQKEKFLYNGLKKKQKTKQNQPSHVKVQCCLFTSDLYDNLFDFIYRSSEHYGFYKTK